MPELIYEKQEDVPAAIKSLTVEKDGKWVANVVAKAELDDFRNRNIEISRERDALTSTIGRLTTDLALEPEKLDDFVTEVKELREVKQQVDDGKLVKDSSLAQAVEAKTGEMKRNFEQQIHGLTDNNKKLTQTNEGLKKDLNRSVIDRAVIQAINDPKSGALPNATNHLLREAYEVFTVDENGKLSAKDSDGNIIYGSDGASAMSPSEWLKKESEKSPFFFQQANGGGAGGGAGGTGAGGRLTDAQLANMGPEEKMNYGREHGLDGRQQQ